MKRILLAGILGCVVFGGGLASAQIDASGRIRTGSTPTKRWYDLRTRTLSRTAPSAFFGPDVLYNNTCPNGTFFLALNPGDVILDTGILPAPDDTDLLGLGGQGCATSYSIDGLEIAYCSDQPLNDVLLTFYEVYDPCTSPIGVTPTASVLIPGLPGSGSGIPICYAVTVDLAGTSAQFAMAASGDGTATTMPNTFGFSYEFTNLTSTQVGPWVAGNPASGSSGCDVLVGTVFEVSDPTGSAPLGTGYGTVDSFEVVNNGIYAGCYYFGGWPNADWASFYLRLFTPDAGCGDYFTTLCPGDGTYPSTSPMNCPCGNTSTPGNGEGCVNSSGGSGGTLRGAAGTGTSILADNLELRARHPAGNAGLLLVNNSIMPVGTAIFDGLTCVGGGPRILPGADNGLLGDLVAGDGFRDLPNVYRAISIVAPDLLTPGTTYFAQYWYRDVLCGPPPAPCVTLCSTPPPGAANFTNALSWMATL